MEAFEQIWQVSYIVNVIVDLHECSLTIPILKQAHIHSQAHEQVPEY